MEIIVDKNHVGGFFANVCTIFAHCNANVGTFQSDTVVYTVTGHGDNVSGSLKSLKNMNSVRI